MDVEYAPAKTPDEYITLPYTGFFDAYKTFECGQCFRFERVSGGRYGGVAMGRYAEIEAASDCVRVCGASESEAALWANFLGLDCDYGALDRRILSHMPDETTAAAVASGRGIRILRQEPWEALCSFIVSQNNNIPRIKKIIAALCEKYGKPIYCGAKGGYDNGNCANNGGINNNSGNCGADNGGINNSGANSGINNGGNCGVNNGINGNVGNVGGYNADNAKIRYAFPEPDVLASAGVDEIFALHTGFRAAYIYDAAVKVAAGVIDLDAIGRMGYSDADAALRQIKGVGPKVSACALLYGFGRTEAFPIDVWIRRVLDRFYGGCIDTASLGGACGLLQQYLFWYIRGMDL